MRVEPPPIGKPQAARGSVGRTRALLPRARGVAGRLLLFDHRGSARPTSYVMLLGVDPRPLTERENEILTFLLSAEFPGVEKLRQQAQTAHVIGRCQCGCATIYLGVDESLPVADEIAQSNAVDAAGRPK